MSVTGNLDGTSACSETTDCYDISLSEDCNELIVAVREAMVVINLAISSVKLAVRAVRRALLVLGQAKQLIGCFTLLSLPAWYIYEESIK